MLGQRFDKQSGFTLVELAIVMIIIGLLLGGVLKGQELIENARVTASISQMKGFQAALYSFKDAYGAVPGDMRNASTRLQGCDAGNANFCVDGNGNSLVGAIATGIQNFNSNQQESQQFWKHLALADLLTGIDPTADPANPAWGEVYPSSSLRGGYHIMYANDTANNISGHALRMQNNSSGAPLTGNGNKPLSPLQAFQIDTKMDDGIPITGIIRGDDTNSSDCDGGGINGSGVYGNGGALGDSKDCVLIFLIEG